MTDMSNIDVAAIERRVTQSVISNLSEKYVLVEKEMGVDIAQRQKQAAEDTFMEIVCGVVCRYFSIDKEYFVSNKKNKVTHLEDYTIAEIRGVFSWICRHQDTVKLSYEAIGRFVNKDHASMIHITRKIEYSILSQRTSNDRLVRADAKQISERLEKELKKRGIK